MKIEIGTPDFLKMLNRWNEGSLYQQSVYCPYILYKIHLKLEININFKQCDECTKIFDLYKYHKKSYEKFNNLGPCPCAHIGHDRTISILNEHGYELINDKWIKSAVKKGG
jgi:hypothetical protein